jgi:hypothetical protein|uniref:RING-type E3 ubiquitin transferase n=1 Tax=Phaeodactylum tricornutum TaxID=2850 RepID=A0A8J9X766_PHATR
MNSTLAVTPHGAVTENATTTQSAETGKAVTSSTMATDAASTQSGLQHDSRFSCNICLEAVTAPVVTQCGHLYCWSCLYRWLEPGMVPGERQALTGMVRYGPIDETRRVCPVCKAPCSVPTIVPIYVRNEPTSPNKRTSSLADSLDDTDDDDVEYDHQREASYREQAHVAAHHTEIVRAANSWETSVTEHADLDGPTSPLPPSVVNVTASSAPDSSFTNTGLRQRLRFRSRDSEIPSAEDYHVVPARPAANSPVRHRSLSESNVGAASLPRNPAWLTPLNPATNRASLSNGLALSLQHAFRQSLPTTAAAQPDQSIPPLHRREGHGSAAVMNSISEQDPNATEFLSRILLLLGSFVILCLLLF